MVPLPGHTPGHSGYQFESQGKKILFWGDTIHTVNAQFPFPDLAAVFDIDVDAALAKRATELDALTGTDILVAGPHQSFPGLGRIYKFQGTYVWSPISYSQEWVER